MSLKDYRRKRDFDRTAEPSGGKTARGGKTRRFVIQKHAATRLHYDFRLELGGTLVSWAVPKGLPMRKGEKRLAIKVEDHPVSYMHFEGTIPKGQYGGGTVQVWDAGTFQPLSKSPLKDLASGKLHLTLQGTKLQGEWHLVRLRDEDQWLVIRGGEDHAKLTNDQEKLSALSGRTMAELAGGKPGKKTAKTAAASPAPFTDEAFIEPMKALSVEKVPAGDWAFEVKLDGYRITAYKEQSTVHLMSRTRNDLTHKFPDVADAIRKLRIKSAVIDGEIVATDEKGRPSFQKLQAYELGRDSPPLYYYAFDLLSVNGKTIGSQPLEKRREKLRAILGSKPGLLRYSSSLDGDADTLLRKVGELGLEGLIGKRARSLYEPGLRSGTWIKLKHQQQQEFVIGGSTEPAGTRKHFGALLVGVYEKGKLVYAGKVGTGFDAATLRDLHDRLAKLERKTCPFSDLPESREGRYGQGITASVMKKCRWVRPVLVCQIKFAEWTRDARLRQPVYLGLRTDKESKDVLREPLLHDHGR